MANVQPTRKAVRWITESDFRELNIETGTAVGGSHTSNARAEADAFTPEVGVQYRVEATVSGFGRLRVRGNNLAEGNRTEILLDETPRILSHTWTQTETGGNLVFTAANSSVDITKLCIFKIEEENESLFWQLNFSRLAVNGADGDSSNIRALGSLVLGSEYLPGVRRQTNAGNSMEMLGVVIANFTPRLNLKLPTQHAFYDVEDFNGNFEKIENILERRISNLERKSGYIIVSTAEDLRKVGTGEDGFTLDAHYLQNADIDLEGIEWTPIGSFNSQFTGSYDGGNFKISNLKIRTSHENVGLFGYVGHDTRVTIQKPLMNIHLVDVDITTNGSNVGGLVGIISIGNQVHVLNCSCDGTITSDGNTVGGLIGSVSTGNDVRIINCTSADVMTSNGNRIGGLVASISAGGEVYIEYCTCDGSIVSNSDNVGGLIGYVNNSGGRHIFNCAVTGSVKGGSTNIGGLIGECNGGNNTVLTDCHTNVEVTSVGQSQNGGVGGLIGLLFESSPAQFVGKNYTLGNVTAECHNVGGVIGKISSASINIKNCYSKGNVSGGSDQNGDSDVGGVIGAVATQNFVANDCYSIGDVSGTGNYVGGIIGRYSSAGAQVSKCFSTGNVSGSDWVGGISGRIGANNNDFSNLYSGGNVTGANFVGGLVGESGIASAQLMSNCYAAGNVKGTGVAGGLVGRISYASQGAARMRVFACFALCLKVTGTTTGRIAGDALSMLTPANNRAFSEMLIGTLGNETAITSSDSESIHGIDMTAEELKTQAAWNTLGFDFANTWKWDSQSMPYLNESVLNEWRI